MTIVLKPVHAREGANVVVLEADNIVAQATGSSDGPLIAQARAGNLSARLAGTQSSAVGSLAIRLVASAFGKTPG